MDDKHVIFNLDPWLQKIWASQLRKHILLVLLPPCAHIHTQWEQNQIIICENRIKIKIWINEMHFAVKSNLQSIALLRYEEEEIYSTSISHQPQIYLNFQHKYFNVKDKT